METDKYHFLDIGGGPDIWKDFETMSNLRAVQLAKQNPQREHIVFDINIPHKIAQQLSHDSSNLHFVQGRLDPVLSIPFQDNSVDRVEMNFLYTPLTQPSGRGKPSNTDEQILYGFFGTSYTDLYIHTLREACRILKPGGVLAITEKQQRQDWIRRIMSKDSWLDMDGHLMYEFGLDMEPNPSYTWEEITDPTITHYATIAMEQRKAAEKIGDRKEMNNLRVFRMEVRKKQ